MELGVQYWPPTHWEIHSRMTVKCKNVRKPVEMLGIDDCTVFSIKGTSASKKRKKSVLPHLTSRNTYTCEGHIHVKNTEKREIHIHVKDINMWRTQKNLVSNHTNIPRGNDIRGRVNKLCPMNCRDAERNFRENNMKVKGPHLFNLLQANVREHHGKTSGPLP